MFHLLGMRIPTEFKQNYAAYSICMLPHHDEARSEADKGGKIYLPPSALADLHAIEGISPWLFRLFNPLSGRRTHCGVLEFTAEEGKVHLPYWMMSNLSLAEGERVLVQLVQLPTGQFTLLQPLTPEFRSIHNPPAVLEYSLRRFSCLTLGDTLGIRYNNKDYEIRVKELKPADAVCIIDCNLNFDFDWSSVGGSDEPTTDGLGGSGHSTPQGRSRQTSSTIDSNDMPYALPEPATAFPGSGKALVDKPRPRKTVSLAAADAGRHTDSVHRPPEHHNPPARRGLPNYDYQRDTIHFFRIYAKAGDQTDALANGNDSVAPFGGKGISLREAKRRDKGLPRV